MLYCWGNEFVVAATTIIVMSAFKLANVLALIEL